MGVSGWMAEIDGLMLVVHQSPFEFDACNNQARIFYSGIIYKQLIYSDAHKKDMK